MVPLRARITNVVGANPLNLVQDGRIPAGRLSQIGPMPPLPSGDDVVDSGEGEASMSEMAVTHVSEWVVAPELQSRSNRTIPKRLSGSKLTYRSPTPRWRHTLLHPLPQPLGYRLQASTPGIPRLPITSSPCNGNVAAPPPPSPSTPTADPLRIPRT